jgi:hypothetical protein
MSKIKNRLVRIVRNLNIKASNHRSKIKKSQYNNNQVMIDLHLSDIHIIFIKLYHY